MVSQPVSHLLADLGVTKSHSRPSVSHDNPYSEAKFKTLTYRPDFPTRFARSKMPARTASIAFAGTTRSITTAGSGCTPLRRASPAG